MIKKAEKKYQRKKKKKMTFKPFSNEEKYLIITLIEMESKGIVVDYEMNELPDGQNCYEFDHMNWAKMAKYELVQLEN